MNLFRFTSKTCFNDLSRLKTFCFNQSELYGSSVGFTPEADVGVTRAYTRGVRGHENGPLMLLVIEN